MHCPLPVPTRIHKKRIGTKTGAVCHAVARSYVERAFAVCSCRASGVLCRGICMRCVTLAVCVTMLRPPKGNPKCICLPSVWRTTKNKNDRGFFELLITPLRQPSASVLVRNGILYMPVNLFSSSSCLRSISRCFLNSRDLRRASRVSCIFVEILFLIWVFLSSFLFCAWESKMRSNRCTVISQVNHVVRFSGQCSIFCFSCQLRRSPAVILSHLGT